MSWYLYCTQVNWNVPTNTINPNLCFCAHCVVPTTKYRNIACNTKMQICSTDFKCVGSHKFLRKCL